MAIFFGGGGGGGGGTTPLEMFCPPLDISNPDPLKCTLLCTIQSVLPPPPPPQTFSMFCFAPLVIFSEKNPGFNSFLPPSGWI